MSTPATLPELRVVWPTRSRTGSQFVLQLTTALGIGLAPSARVNGHRTDRYKPETKTGDFKAMFEEGRAAHYLRDNGIRALKYEDPGKDDFVLALLDLAPEARFVASYRRVESVIESHHNLRWGHGVEDVLYQFSACATLYEQLADAGRMFLVDVEDRSRFDLEAFCRFLDSPVSRRAKALVDRWQPINDLKHQVEKSGETYVERVSTPRLDRLRRIHPWIDDVERRYLDLVERSSAH